MWTSVRTVPLLISSGKNTKISFRHCLREFYARWHSASFFLFGRAGAASDSRHIRTHTFKCRRAVGLSTTMILAYSAADDRRWRNLRLAMTLILAKIISVSIPHAGSSNTTPFSRRTTHNLVSWFSRAAIFPAHRPPSRGCRARSSRFNPWLPSSCP